MKIIRLLVFAVTLWATCARAQNFNLPVFDSLSLILDNGAITISTFRYEDRYDTFFEKAREEFFKQKEKIVKANEGYLPAEVRLYKTWKKWDIRVFAEPGPYNPDVEQESIYVQNGRPRPNYTIVFCDLDNERIYGNRIILTAEDSTKMMALLSTDLAGWRTVFLKHKKEGDRKDVYRSYWQIRKDSLYPNSYYHSNSYQHKDRFVSRFGIGPSMTNSGFYISTHIDIGYVFYDYYRQPVLKLGIFSTTSVGSSLLNDTSGWQTNGINSYGLKVAFFSNGKNYIWPGFRVGLANQKTHEKQQNYFMFGLSLDNARLFDYNLDFFVSKKDNFRAMLSVKFPF